jgi:hypothetical protein
MTAVLKLVIKMRSPLILNLNMKNADLSNAVRAPTLTWFNLHIEL